MMTDLPVFFCLPHFLSLPDWHFFSLSFLFHLLSSVPPLLCAAYISCVVCSYSGDLRTHHSPHSTGSPILSVSLFHGEPWQLHTWPRAKVDNRSKQKKDKHMQFLFISHLLSLTLTWHTWGTLLLKRAHKFKAIACFFNVLFYYKKLRLPDIVLARRGDLGLVNAWNQKGRRTCLVTGPPNSTVRIYTKGEKVLQIHHYQTTNSIVVYIVLFTSLPLQHSINWARWLRESPWQHL